MKHLAKFQRDFEVEIEADNVKAAEAIAQKIRDNLPEGTCKILSIIAEGAVVEHSAPDIEPPRPPLGRPPTGSTPGTPTIKQDVLVDAIAEAA